MSVPSRQSRHGKSRCSIWGFTEIRVLPNHPFIDGIFHGMFHCKPSSYWGTPMTMETYPGHLMSLAGGFYDLYFRDDDLADGHTPTHTVGFIYYSLLYPIDSRICIAGEYININNINMQYNIYIYIYDTYAYVYIYVYIYICYIHTHIIYIYICI